MWWCAVALAQETVDLSGQVLEYGSGIPLAGAVVVYGDQAVIADERGHFQLTVPVGPVAIEVSANDHRGATVEVDVGRKGERDVELRLERISWAVEEVTVYGAATDTPVRDVLDEDQLRRVPGSFGDPIRALQSLPSVTRGPDLAGDIVARGAEALNTAAYIDGIRVPFLFHFLVGRSVVNPALLEDVEFYPGAVPPRYGDVLQAVINARSSFGPAEPGLHGRVHVDLLDIGASLEGNLPGGWTIRYAGRRSFVGTAYAAFTAITRAAQGNADPSVKPASIRVPYRDQQIRVVRDMGDDRVSATVVSARDGVTLIPEWTDADGDGIADPPPPVPLPFDPNQLLDARFVRAQLRWDHFGERGHWSAWGTGGRDIQQNLVPGIGLVGRNALEFARLDQGWVSLGVDAFHTFAPSLELHTGGEITIQPSYLQNLIEVPAITASATRTWAGPFAEVAWSPGQWRVAPGFRYSVHRLLGAAAGVPEPRLSVRSEIGDVWAVVGYVGALSQGPTLDQAGAGFAQGDLAVARAVQSTVGVEARWPTGWALDVDVYETEMRDLVIRETDRVVEFPPDNAFTVDVEFTNGAPVINTTRPDPNIAILREVPVYRSQSGRAYGLEVQLKLAPRGAMFGWVAGSFGRSFRFAEDGTRTRANADVPFNLVAVWGAGLGKDWTLSGRGQLSSGLVYTPSLGQFLPRLDTFRAVEGETNQARFPTYGRVDVRIDKTWTGKRARWTTYLDVYNLTNQHNPVFATYNWGYSDLTVQAFVPILPTFGLEVDY